MRRKLCIIAAQRAGTTSLAGALAQTGFFQSFGEVFHTERFASVFRTGADLYGGAFLKFADENAVGLGDISTYQSANDVADRFMAYLQRLADAKYVLFDVKFDSWQVLQPFWSFLAEEPFFLRYLKGNNTIFILLSRRDLAAQIASLQIAERARKWHELGGSDIGTQQFAVDMTWADERARQIVSAEVKLDGYLGGDANVMRICYEDLFTDGVIDPGLIDFVSAWFDISLPRDLAPEFVRNELDKAAVISNYAEITEAVARIARDLGRPDWVTVAP